MPPPDPNSAGESGADSRLRRHAAFWVIQMFCPSEALHRIMTAPLRGVVELFASTRNATAPDPVTVAAEWSSIHESVVTVQLRPAFASTGTVSAPPADG